MSGNIELRNYEDAQGVKRTGIDIIAQDVEFLTPKPNKAKNVNPIRIRLVIYNFASGISCNQDLFIALYISPSPEQEVKEYAQTLKEFEISIGMPERSEEDYITQSPWELNCVCSLSIIEYVTRSCVLPRTDE